MPGKRPAERSSPSGDDRRRLESGATAQSGPSALPTRNCRFAVRCPNDWHALVETDDEDVRYCPQCSDDVHRCRGDDDLRHAVDKGYCIAIAAEDANGGELPYYVGRPWSDYDW